MSNDTRSTKRSVPAAPARKVETPWGRATVVQRIAVPQRAGDKQFESVLELLAGEGGEQLVRIGYSTGGAVRRGPVTLRLRDLVRLRRTVGSRAPELAETLGWKEAGA
jgi:hypothetical protein